MIEPYFDDGTVTLYLGDSREIVPSLGLTVDAVVTDCPYGETSLDWDQWQDGWPAVAASTSRTLWAFGSMRMFLEHGAEFAAAGWKFSHDIIWEKQNGSGFHNDRFKRVHENALLWYQGEWGEQRHEVPTTQDAVKRTVRTKRRPPQMGQIDKTPYVSEDGGPRLMRSVIEVRNMHGRAIHRTEKPVGILDPLITYSCPPGGLVLDMFAGSGSTLEAARLSGRRAVGIERHEPHAEAAARRLSQSTIPIGA